MSKAMDRLVSIHVFQEDVNALKVPKPNPWYLLDRAAFHPGGFGTGGVMRGLHVLHDPAAINASPGFGTGGTLSGELPSNGPLDVSPGFDNSGSIFT